MRSYKMLASSVIAGTCLCISGTSLANECAHGSRGQIGQLHYDSANSSVPTFTLVGEPDRWMVLSPKYDLESAWGKAMLAIALTALSSATEVHINCTKEGEVYELDIGSYK